jgi:hypothetical protein
MGLTKYNLHFPEHFELDAEILPNIDKTQLEKLIADYFLDKEAKPKDYKIIYVENDNTQYAYEINLNVQQIRQALSVSQLENIDIVDVNIYSIKQITSLELMDYERMQRFLKNIGAL